MKLFAVSGKMINFAVNIMQYDMQALHKYFIAPSVTAFSTKRQGGVSTGNYASFNINPYCGDDVEAIRKNRAALCAFLGIDDSRLILSHQTHETHAAVIDKAFLSLSPQERQQALEGIDALMTNVRGVCIGVSTADCIPLLLYDQQHEAVCAVHAGWRGTVSRIVRHAIAAMNSAYATRPETLIAQIGPGISLDSFEVGQEVYDAFQQAGFDMPSISRRYPAKDGSEKWHIDLPHCNYLQLTAAGVQPANISQSGICTVKQSDEYFSARRLGIASGRIYTAAMLHEKKQEE